MIAVAAQACASTALAVAHVAVTDGLDADLTREADDDVLHLLRDVDRLRNRLAAIDHRLILEAERRGLPTRNGATSTATFLRDLLRLHPQEAKARVSAAEAGGARRSLIGEVLPPAYPLVARAQAAGDISPQHARVITRCIEALPDDAREEQPVVEAELVEQSYLFDPVLLSRCAKRVTAHLDPDGRLRDREYRERCRGFDFSVRPDGSSSGRFEANAELTERLRVAFDSLAAPASAANDQPDPRTASQRRHDALIDVLGLVQRAELLPNAGGVTATIVVTVSDEDYRNRTGYARTGHGTMVPTGEALDWCTGGARVFVVALNSLREGTAFGSEHRISTENQRLAMIARDQGCTFPGCDRPPQWCEAHHIWEFVDGGPTSIDNGTLTCGYHHRTFERLGWQVVMRDGRPAWIPPPWIDPARVPRTNAHSEH